MIQIIAAIFLLLHGLVHLLYYGQSYQRFELQPGLTWPDEAWAFSKPLGEKGTRRLAGVCCVIAAAGFLIGSLGVFSSQPWWRPVTAASAVFSALLYILFLNGRWQGLANQGGVGVLIDAAILLAAIFNWPRLGF